MSLQRLAAQTKGIIFEVEFKNIAENEIIVPNGKLSPLINCDEQRIMQVLLGLQSNALKFTRSGKVMIHVSINKTNLFTDEKEIEISVEDTGVGISESD